MILKVGGFVARIAWPKSTHLQLEQLPGPIATSYFTIQDDHTIEPWCPRHCDLLATDWFELQPVPVGLEP